MGRSAATQPLNNGNRLLAVTRIASVNRVSLEEVPTLSPRVIKYRRIAHVRSDNQRVGRGNSVQFQTSVAQLSGGRLIKWSHVNVSLHCKRTRDQYRQCNDGNTRR